MDLLGKVIQLLDRSYQIELDLIAGLSEEKRSKFGTHDHWSAKDVVAHCAYWKTHHARNILAVAEGEIPTRIEDYNEMNNQVFEMYRLQAWEEILALMERGYRSLLDCLELEIISDLGNQDVLPWQEGRPIWREIVNNGYTHPVFHLASLYTEFGDIQHASEIHEEIVTSLNELDDDPEWIGILRYNLACHYSLCGDTERAVSILRFVVNLVMKRYILN
jgi:hypothetical protein